VATMAIIGYSACFFYFYLEATFIPNLQFLAYVFSRDMDGRAPPPPAFQSPKTPVRI